ncbi:MAG: hypothetical protein GX023_07960, partial [Tissierellia bacterium]|nr:hypothetical protein [Tissierellia bacterium]
MDITLIGVPIMYGSDRDGVQYGPDKLRGKNIASLITKNKKIFTTLETYLCHMYPLLTNLILIKRLSIWIL